MYRSITITLTLCLLLLGAGLAGAAPEAPGDLKLSPPEAIEASKSPVDFSHAKHGAAQVECATCHHTWDGQSDIKSCSSQGCHDQPGKKDANAFYSAFHSKKTENSCLGCHKIVKKNGKPVPVSCADCHPK